MAKIALPVDQALSHRRVYGTPASLAVHKLAGGDVWSVTDIVCNSGPGDRPYPEQHADYRIAIVLAGSFQYRGGCRPELMTPGTLLLGNAGQCFECSHDHSAGDRCLSFGYSPERFEALLAAASGSRRPAFRGLRVSPLRELSPLTANVCAALATGATDGEWEELSAELATLAIEAASGRAQTTAAAPGALARVSRAIRMIDRDAAARLPLDALAHEAGLSPYYFLRLFHQVTGVTPQRYVRRARLRDAAVRLAADAGRILDIALDCGFDDVSTFNRAFRSEFGMSPQAYRKQPRGL